MLDEKLTSHDSHLLIYPKKIITQRVRASWYTILKNIFKLPLTDDAMFVCYFSSTRKYLFFPNSWKRIRHKKEKQNSVPASN